MSRFWIDILVTAISTFLESFSSVIFKCKSVTNKLFLCQRIYLYVLQSLLALQFAFEQFFFSFIQRQSHEFFHFVQRVICTIFFLQISTCRIDSYFKSGAKWYRDVSRFTSYFVRLSPAFANKNSNGTGFLAYLK